MLIKGISFSVCRAKWEQPDCLRARYGLGDTRNGFHGSGASWSNKESGLEAHAHIVILPHPCTQAMSKKRGTSSHSFSKALHLMHGCTMRRHAGSRARPGMADLRHDDVCTKKANFKGCKFHQDSKLWGYLVLCKWHRPQCGQNTGAAQECRLDCLDAWHCSRRQEQRQAKAEQDGERQGRWLSTA